MKLFILTLLVVVLTSGCAGSKQQIFVLKKTETAIMNYVAIVPMKEPQGRYVANLFGEYEERRYQVPVEQEFLNAYVKKFLSGRGNQLYVQEGVLLIKNSEGGKLRIGGDFTRDEGMGEVSVDSNGGVFLPQSERSGGLVTSILGWIF
jgi:hypothetical protein